MPLNIGDRLAHYDVTALIGEGGMGQVYQATDTKLNRQVALTTERWIQVTVFRMSSLVVPEFSSTLTTLTGASGIPACGGV